MVRTALLGLPSWSVFCGFWGQANPQEARRYAVGLPFDIISHMTGFLLGSGGTDTESGALAAYVPDRTTRRELISAIAEECAAAAQVRCTLAVVSNVMWLV